MKYIIGLLFFLWSCQSFSQSYLEPTHSNSFGLNRHTNRDEPYFIHTDSQKNLYIIGTTEKDSTFTDIVAIKLNKDHETEWQKIISFDTDLSYDIPITSFVTTEDELIVLSRSSTSQSLSNGVLFLSKFSSDGNLLFKKRINSVGNTPYVDFNNLNWEFKSDGSLNLVFNAQELGAYINDTFHFIATDKEGVLLKAFTQTILNKGIIGKVQNDIFYFIQKDFSFEAPEDVTINYYEVKDENEMLSVEITDATFVSVFEKIPFFDESVIINIDSNGNCLVTAGLKDINGQGGNLNLSAISTSGLLYSINTEFENDYDLVTSFLDEQNERIVVVKDVASQSTHFISNNENNTPVVLKKIEGFSTNLLKYNNDGSLLLIANGKTKLIDKQYNEINSFSFPTSFDIVNISKVENNELAVLGFRQEKMFENSDFITQIDIVCEKISSTVTLDTFVFSGSGTSRVFQESLISDFEDNYYVLTTERLGPSYFGLGGTKAPLSNRIIKYNADLQKLWEVEAPEEIFNINDTNGSQTNYYFDDGNLYLDLSIVINNNLENAIYKVNPDGVMDFMYTIPTPFEFLSDGEFIYVTNNGFTYPANSHIFKIQKSSGEIVSDLEVGNEFVKEMFTNTSELYYYTLSESDSNEPDVVKLYNEGNLIYSKELSRNYGVRNFGLSSNFSLLLSTEYSPDFILHQIGINGSYQFYNAEDQITGVEEYESGKFLITLKNGVMVVLDSQLNFLSSAGSTETYNPRLFGLKNYVLVNTPFSNSVKIIDDSGSHVDEFLIPGILEQSRAVSNSSGELILTGDFGYRISTYDHYGWRRGFIHKYNLLESLETNEYSFESSDEVMVYPNPSNKQINISLKEALISNVKIYDLSGKLILETVDDQIDVSHVSPGIYLLQITSNEDKSFNSKFIKD